MTISKTPRTDYRHAYKDPQMHRFTKRPDSAVTRLPAGAAVFRPDPSPKHYPAYVQHLPDDAWPDSALQEAARIQRAMSTDMPPMPEPIERETWRDVWADIRGVVLCAAFVLTVLAFGAHVAGLWGA